MGGPKTTDLRALATIGAPAAPRFQGEALSRVRYAQRPVHKRLDLRVGVAGNPLNLRQAQFAPEDLEAEQAGDDDGVCNIHHFVTNICKK